MLTYTIADIWSDFVANPYTEIFLLPLFKFSLHQVFKRFSDSFHPLDNTV